MSPRFDLISLSRHYTTAWRLCSSPLLPAHFIAAFGANYIVIPKELKLPHPKLVQKLDDSMHLILDIPGDCVWTGRHGRWPGKPASPGCSDTEPWRPDRSPHHQHKIPAWSGVPSAAAACSRHTLGAWTQTLWISPGHFTVSTCWISFSAF